MTEGSEPRLQSTNGTGVHSEKKIIESVIALLPENARFGLDKLKNHQKSSPLAKLLKSF